MFKIHPDFEVFTQQFFSAEMGVETAEAVRRVVKEANQDGLELELANSKTGYKRKA